LKRDIIDIAIIGAGAAGLFAAANLKINGKIIVFEKNKTAGRKLLLTGSGRCNFTNASPLLAFLKHYGSTR